MFEGRELLRQPVRHGREVPRRDMGSAVGEGEPEIRAIRPEASIALCLPGIRRHCPLAHSLIFDDTQSITNQGSSPKLGVPIAMMDWIKASVAHCPVSLNSPEVRLESHGSLDILIVWLAFLKWPLPIVHSHKWSGPTMSIKDTSTIQGIARIEKLLPRNGVKSQPIFFCYICYILLHFLHSKPLNLWAGLLCNIIVTIVGLWHMSIKSKKKGTKFHTCLWKTSVWVMGQIRAHLGIIVKHTNNYNHFNVGWTLILDLKRKMAFYSMIYYILAISFVLA